MYSTRKEALQNNATRYFTGAACVNGHVSARRAKTGECLDCRAAGLKQWRNQNPDKVKEHNKNQYETHAEKIKVLVATYRRKNIDVVREKKRQYQRDNPHIFRAILARREASQLQRTPCWLTDEDRWMMQQAYEIAARRTKQFGFAWHVDHIIPLQGKKVSGLHVPLNLQVIPGVENRRKSNYFEVGA